MRTPVPATMPTRDAPGWLIDTTEGLQSMVDEITDRDQKPLIFVDLEGVNLSRDGTIAIMQVLMPPKPVVYLIDVHLLRQDAFETPCARGNTWKEILESDSYAKVFFDVRNDSDALFSHYGVKLRGVIDLQLLEFVTRPGYNRPRYVQGLSKCISQSGILTWQDARTWEQAKEDGRRHFAPELGGSYDVFLQRPLSSAMQKYCAEDVLQLPPLLVDYARKINRHLAAQVSAATVARVLLSQSPTYNPHGREKAIGPTIRWQRYLAHPTYPCQYTDRR
jgi:exonuclease 3'-5' domain-containing protein 1